MSNPHSSLQRALANKDYREALLIFGDMVSFITHTNISAAIAEEEGDEDEMVKYNQIALASKLELELIISELAAALDRPTLTPSRNPKHRGQH